MTTSVATLLTPTSPTATSIGQTTATLGATITGGSGITERGTVYGTSANPTGNGLAEGGTATGVFTDGPQGLSQGTHYYYRGYAINAGGTAHSPDGKLLHRAGPGLQREYHRRDLLGDDDRLGVRRGQRRRDCRDAFRQFLHHGSVRRHAAQRERGVRQRGGPGQRQLRGVPRQRHQRDGVRPEPQHDLRRSLRLQGQWSPTAAWTRASTTARSPATGNETSADYPTPRWTALYNRGTPAYTYAVGDTLAYIFEFGVNTGTDNWTIDWGIGTSTDGSGWTWRTAYWSRTDGANQVWRNTNGVHQFTSAGTYYYAGRMVTNAYTYYADRDWTTDLTNLTLDASSYFTVTALSDPTGVSAITNTANSATQADQGRSGTARTC